MSKDIEVFNYLATVYHFQGKLDKAKNCQNKATELEKFKILE